MQTKGSYESVRNTIYGIFSIDFCLYISPPIVFYLPKSFPIFFCLQFFFPDLIFIYILPNIDKQYFEDRLYYFFRFFTSGDLLFVFLYFLYISRSSYVYPSIKTSSMRSESREKVIDMPFKGILERYLLTVSFTTNRRGKC